MSRTPEEIAREIVAVGYCPAGDTCPRCQEWRENIAQAIRTYAAQEVERERASCQQIASEIVGNVARYGRCCHEHAGKMAPLGVAECIQSKLYARSGKAGE